MRNVLAVLVVSVLLIMPAFAQSTPQWELFGGYSHAIVDVTRSSTQMNGFHFSVAENVSSTISGVVDVDGQFRSENTVTAAGVSGPPGRTNLTTFLFGPRFSYRKAKSFVPSTHALFGVVRGSQGFLNNSITGTHFGMAFGGSFDFKVKRNVAVRVVQADYLLTTFQDLRRQNLRISTGLLLQLGRVSRESKYQ